LTFFPLIITNPIFKSLRLCLSLSLSLLQAVNCAFINNANTAVLTRSTTSSSSASSPITLRGNVFYYSYDKSTIDIRTTGNIIANNLATGMMKEMRGKSAQDLQMPASYSFSDSQNYVTGNVAAGSDRLGFFLPGQACSGTVSNAMVGN
jgi:hypothetical protein